MKRIAVAYSLVFVTLFAIVFITWWRISTVIIYGPSAWSPDQKRIVAVGCSKPIVCESIHVINVDGSGEQEIVGDPAVYYYSPMWTPDSKRIIFQSHSNGNQQIYSVDVDGSNLHSISSNDHSDFFPVGSSDGQQILFLSSRSGRVQLYIMNINGSNVRLLVKIPPDLRVKVLPPAWSVHGGNIAMILSSTGGEDNVYIVKEDGSTLQKITTTSGNYDEPVWNPDGSRVSFRRLNPPEGVYAFDIKSSYFGKVDYPLGMWSPDGTKMAFMKGSNLFLVDVNGGGTTLIGSTPPGVNFDDGSLHWGNLGNQVSFFSFSDKRRYDFVVATP